MRIVFESMRVRAFRSIASEQRITFKQDAGFYLVAGRNEVRPRMGGNATGKSTLWDALCWALTGKTARGLRGKTVCSWHTSDKTAVELVFVVNGERYWLKRTQSPNTAQLGKSRASMSPVTDEQLEQITGLTYPLVLRVLLMSQFGQFFFDLTPAVKLQAFSDALGLQVWMDASKKANSRAAELDLVAADARDKASEHVGRVRVLREQLDSTRTQEPIESVSKAQARVECARTEERAARLKKHAARAEVEEHKSHTSGIQTSWAVSEGAMKAVESDLIGREGQLQKVLAAIATIGSNPDRCPTCGQVLKKRKEIERKVHGLQAEAADVRRDIARAEEKKSKLARRLDSFKDQVREQNKELDYLIAREYRRDQTHADALQVLRDAQGKLLQAQSLRRGAREQRRTLKQQLREAKGLLHATKRDASRAASHAERVRKWVETFKDIRLWITQSALQELEREVSSSFTDLGLRGWQVQFKVERETSRGEVSRGFSCSIRSPGSPEYVPWESWSGGETQRLRIAGAVGLKNLFAGRCGITTNLEVWDEPTQHLSDEGVDSLLDYFAARASREGTQIWLTDHRSLSYGGFAGGLCMVKDKQGSRIEPLV